MLSDLSFGNIILAIIFVIDVATVLAVLIIGSRHDSHHVSTAAESQAIARIRQEYGGVPVATAPAHLEQVETEPETVE